MEIIGLKSHIIKPNADLIQEILQVLKKWKIRLKNGDILVITSKIVSVCEGRTVPCKNRAAFVKLIKKEADVFFGGKVPLALKDGILIAQSGIDRSNSEKGTAILWPKDAWQTAAKIRAELCAKLKLRNFGVLITDSNCHPLRWGTIGVALAFAGFEGVEDVRNSLDLFGNRFMLTKKGTADQLASASVCVMGETNEQIPMALIRGAPVKFSSQTPKKSDIFISPKDCLFAPVYGSRLKNFS